MYHDNRTVNLVVSTSRLTVRALVSGIAKFLNRTNHRVQIKKDARYQQKVRRKQEGPQGKQTVRQLVRNSNGLKQLPDIWFSLRPKMKRCFPVCWQSAHSGSWIKAKTGNQVY